METIERAEGRIDIDESGFILENDAYWWNEDGAYFRCSTQPPSMAFTFKYPDYDKADAATISHISNFMEKALTTLYAEEDASEYLDYTSFAQWVLAHDIMGTTDAAGTNMYYVMDAMDDEGRGNAPLRTGPMWDFGCIMRTATADWSHQHLTPLTFYPQLFKDEKFVREYIQAFERIKPIFINDITARLDSLRNTYGTALRQSILLDDPSYANIEGKISWSIRYLTNRMNIVSGLIERDFATVGIHDNDAQKPTLVKRIDLMGNDFTKVGSKATSHGIYIEKWSDGTVTKTFR